MGLINDLIVRIRGDKSHLDATLNGAKGSINSFGSVVKKIGGWLAAAFAVRKIVDFGKEVTRLAIEAQAAEAAFKKLGDPTLLSGLIRATRSMVDDSDLMGMAVKADALGMSLQDMAKYFKFATDRAVLMNKPVAEFIDLIINGVGRQSSRALVQLGVSAGELKNIVKDSGGFIAAGLDKYITDASVKMGVVADTTNVKIQQIATSWTQIKENIGKVITESKTFQKILDGINLTLDKIREAQKGPETKGKELATRKLEDMTGTAAQRKQYITDYINELTKLKSKAENDPTLKKYNEAGPLTWMAHKDEQWALKQKDNIISYASAIDVLSEALKNFDTKVGVVERLGFIPGGKLKGTGTIPTSTLDTSTLKSQYGKPEDVYAREWDMGKRELDQIEQVTQGLYNQQDAVNMLADSFQDLFEGGSKGFENMVNSMIRSLSRLVAEILAKQAVLAILKILSSWNKGWLSTIAGGVSGAAGGAVDTIQNVPAVGGGGIASAGVDKIQFELRGTNLVASVDRTRLMLSNNT